MDKNKTRPARTRLATLLLVATLAGSAFAPPCHAIDSRIPSTKSSVHQCFYSNASNAALCPDGAFISDLSAAHTVLADAGGPLAQAARADRRAIVSAQNRQYMAGAFYASGDVVTHQGQLYRCRPYPANNLCGQAPASYEPGTGWDWEKAWVKVK